MANKIVYIFDNNQNITHKEVSSSYILQERESFNLFGFTTPVWSNGSVVEGASQSMIDDLKIENIKARQEFEIPNLKLGAKRIASGFSGDEVSINNQIAFAKDKYLWAKGEIKLLGESVSALYLIELQELNAKRVLEGDIELTEDQYKKIIINDYEIRERFLNTFNTYITIADHKLTSLLNNRDTVNATTVIELMENVDKNTTQAQAQAILTQILEA